MSMDPMTPEEREDAQRFWHIRDYGFHYIASRRYEATVRAADDRAEDWMRRGLSAIERAEKAEDEAAALLEGYLRLQEAVVTETTSLPDVRRRILAVCDLEDGA